MPKTPYYYTPRHFPSYGEAGASEQREALRAAITYKREKLDKSRGSITDDSDQALQILGALFAMGLEVVPRARLQGMTSSEAAYAHECFQYHVNLDSIQLANDPLAIASREHEQSTWKAARKDNYGEYKRLQNQAEQTAHISDIASALMARG